MKNKNFKSILKKIFLMTFGIFVFSFSIIIEAAEPDIKMKEGNLVFRTTDTKASTDITWSTVGFIITREKCITGPKANGGYPLKLEHGEIKLKPEWKQEFPYTSDKIEVVFTIPEKVVNKALIDAGAGEIEPGDTLYLHGIHQVKHNGRPYGSPKYSLPEIKYAEGWSNPNDFNDRFDRRVTFVPAGPQPISETYLTADGKVIMKRDLDDVSMGTKAEVRHESTVEYKGKTLYLSKSYQSFKETDKRINGTTNFVSSVNAKDYEEQLGRVRLRKKMQAPGGLEFVAVYREKGSSPSAGDGSGGSIGEEIESELLDPNPYGVIAADQRSSEEYDVLLGIPTTDSLYANAFTDHFLLGYQFQKKSGTKTYPVSVTKTYHLSWTEKEPDGEEGYKEVSRSDTQTVTKNYNIKRPYSYWVISNVDYYKIARAEIRNYALPSGAITLNPTGYTVPALTFTHSDAESSHVKAASNKGSISLSGSVSGGSSRPSVPSEDFKSQAEGAVGRIKVQNDTMAFDGAAVMKAGWKEDETEEPTYIESYPEEIGEDILYRSGMIIDKNKSNGTKNSSGTLYYERVKALNPKKTPTLSYPIANLNEVVIHTPTVCDATVSTQTKYNQMLNPDKGRASLVLDRPFTICLPTAGDHRYIEGYGYRDYDRYIESRHVRFPFDVYKNKVFYKANTWITITEEYTEFYLPIWVEEGKYTVDFKAPAINARANGAMGQTETLANLEVSNYAATDTIHVEVSGRIYGLSLYDISDYPIWEDVFRYPKSLKPTGFTYKVGVKNQNGTTTSRNKKYTFPLINGSHPGYRNIGAIKTGYVTRFYLTTIGNMYTPADYVRITPRFYYVDEKGKNRKEVDIYYSETFNGKKNLLVKAGSDLDKENKKGYILGDPYLSVPKAEIQIKAALEGKSVKEVMGAKRKVFTFTNIMIPESLRTYTGANYTPTGTVPVGVSPGKVAISKQKWYCEYYLPAEIHAVKKGFDVYQYAREHYGIDYKESFWLKKGYVVVNFDIETIQDGKRHLSYINPKNAETGYCNMWKLEGFQDQKTDFKNNKFDFSFGDYILYFTDKSVAQDYITGGTH